MQYTLASKDFFGKGCLGIVDDLPYDVIICSEDIKMVSGAVDGQLPPQSDLYPENMIGLIAVNADQSEKGQYFARIKKVSSGAWKCVLARA